MNARRRRFDGYGRVSRRQGRIGPGYISPQVQRDGIDRWAEYSNVEIDQWHFDEDQSGGTQQRPGIREAIRRVEQGEVEGIVCLKLSRFGRNVIGAMDDIRRLREAGGDVVFVEEQINTSGPTGQLLLTVMFAFAEWERENMSQNFVEAKRRAVKRGAYISRTPYGYERTGDGTLAPHPEQAQHVTEAFRRAASQGISAAHHYLAACAAGRTWTISTTRRMLAMRCYLGEIRVGDDLVNTDAHPPLVSRAVFEAAQQRPAARHKAAIFPLSGLARCGTCDGPMIGGRAGKGVRTYRCAATLSLHRGPHCPRGAHILADTLEAHVREQAALALQGARAEIGDTDTDTLVLAERAMAETEAELDAFAADLTLRRALGGRYHEHLETRVQAVEEARRAYRERARQAHAVTVVATSDILAAVNLTELSELLRGMLRAIVVEPGRGNVDRRVTFVPLDADSAPRVAAAKDRE